MVDVVLSTVQILVALFLVVLNGFFVAAEFAFVRIRGTSVEQLAEEGRAGSGALQDVMADLDNYLATTQLGITIASLGLGWVGEPAVAALIDPVLGEVLPEGLVHFVAFAIGFSVITFLHVVFGELAPKTIAIAKTERLSLFLAPPMKVAYYVLYPGIVVFNGAANAFTRMLGIPPASETDETLGEREIRRVLAQSGEEGDIDVAEVEMIERVFDLDDTIAREVMVPRPDVVSIPADATLADVRETVFEAGHTRYPVHETESADQIVGFLDVKDVLRASADGEWEADSGVTPPADAERITAGDLAHDLIVVPETMTLSDLLMEFRAEHMQMAAIIDEWGSLKGIVTVEDVVEAVVGDLRDRFDVADREHSIRSSSDGGYDVDGGVPLSLVSETIGTEFESDAVDTIGGLVLDDLGRAPEVGDRVEVAGHTLEVTGVDGTRITTVHVSEREAGTDENGEAEDEYSSEPK